MPLEEEKAEKFFREFWQRKPLLMRNAIPNFICPLDTDELAGLACEDEFNFRLMRVVKQQEKEKWTRSWTVSGGSVANATSRSTLELSD